MEPPHKKNCVIMSDLLPTKSERKVGVSQRGIKFYSIMVGSGVYSTQMRWLSYLLFQKHNSQNYNVR